MITIPDSKEANSYKWLTDLIPEGKGKGVSLDHLGKITGTDKVKLKYKIMDARLAGILICSGNSGYYFPADELELREYTNRREQYIRTADEAMEHFRKAGGRK